MRLRVLGCSGTYPTPASPSSGYLVEDDDTCVWVDAGSGTFAAMQAVTDLNRVDALFLSHVHSDHCLDIFPLYYALRFGARSRRPGKFPLYVPEGTEAHLGSFLVGDAGCRMGDVFEFAVVGDAGHVDVGAISFGFAATDHPVPTLAVRAESGGRSLVYSADTGPRADLERFAADCDLFVCEATYQNGHVGPPLHLTAAQAGELAKRARCDRLVLTHLWPANDPDASLLEATEASDCPVEVTRAGAVYDV